MWWWGDGYPQLSDNPPDAPWYAALPRARWLAVVGEWTAATQDEAVCQSLAIIDGLVDSDTNALLTQPTHCIRPDGHLGVHGSATRSTAPGDPTVEVFGWE